MIKVSIVIPVYEVEIYIEECLNSVMAQTYTNYECIIVDDCGKDHSIEIAEQKISKHKKKERFQILHHTNNRGVSAARNTGLQIATGDYVYFLDSDDKILPNAIEDLVNMVEKYPNVDLVQGNMISQDGSKCCRFNKGYFPEYSDDRNWIRHQILQGGTGIAVWNKLMRLNFIRQHKIKFMEGVVGEDSKWCFDFQKHIHSIAFVENDCYWYRRDNETSYLHEVDKTRYVVSHWKIVEEIAPYIADNLEKEFICNMISPHYKNRFLPLCKDINIIKNEIRLILKRLKNTKGIYLIKLEAFFWLMPLWMTNNIVFSKFYYELEKKKIMA